MLRYFFLFSKSSCCLQLSAYLNDIHIDYVMNFSLQCFGGNPFGESLSHQSCIQIDFCHFQGLFSLVLAPQQHFAAWPLWRFPPLILTSPNILKHEDLWNHQSPYNWSLSNILYSLDFGLWTIIYITVNSDANRPLRISIAKLQLETTEKCIYEQQLTCK